MAKNQQTAQKSDGRTLSDLPPEQRKALEAAQAARKARSAARAAMTDEERARDSVNAALARIDAGLRTGNGNLINHLRRVRGHLTVDQKAALKAYFKEASQEVETLLNSTGKKGGKREPSLQI